FPPGELPNRLSTAELSAKAGMTKPPLAGWASILPAANTPWRKGFGRSTHLLLAGEPAHARDFAARGANARDRLLDRLQRERHVEGVGVNERGHVAHDGDVAAPKQKISASQLRGAGGEFAAERLLLHVAVARAGDAAGGQRDLHEP